MLEKIKKGLSPAVAATSLDGPEPLSQILKECSRVREDPEELVRVFRVKRTN